MFLFLAGFSIGISGAIIPGPLTFFTVSGALRTGSKAGLKTMAGHIAVEFFLILCLYLGLREILTFPPFLSAISILGGAALMIMGIILFSGASGMTLPDKKDLKDHDKGLILGGMLFTITSPGFIIWWATIGVSTLSRAALSGAPGIIALIAGHWTADVAWYGSLSYGVDKGRAYMTDTVYRHTLRGSAVLLVLLGAAFILKR